MSAPLRAPLRDFAPAKINLSLFVGRRREDGYHELVSVVQPLRLGDAVRLEAAGGDRDEVVGAGVDGPNLAAAALARFREATGWDGAAVRVTIDKQTPVAGGMGGGSSDAAATLRLIAAAAGRPRDDVLAALAPRLGADVLSLLRPHRCLMTGIGEVVRPLPQPSRAFGVVVLPGRGPLPTHEVYDAFDRMGLGRSAAALAALEREALAGRVETHNDLEPAAVALRPEIAGVLGDARDSGAAHAMVSGSGPTVVALFASPEEAVAAAEALRPRHPGVVATAPYEPSRGFATMAAS
jgi:4-diphosphocytidyl-2-C-methyl-D-erythritol kinase